jgi:transcriptional regulator with XRE-family HTH domain
MSSARKRQVICSCFAQVLREERVKRKLSLSALAEKAGLSYQMISYVEREMRNPTLDTLLRITEVLEMELSDVAARAGKMAARRETAQG